MKLTGRGYCRWYKGVIATTTDLTGGDDPEDDTAYPLLARDTDDGPGKRLVIRASARLRFRRARASAFMAVSTGR